MHVCKSKEIRLTGDKKHDSCSKGAVEPFKGGEVCKGHDASDDACEARHPWKDHEGSGGIPVSWKETGRDCQTCHFYKNVFSNLNIHTTCLDCFHIDSLIWPFILY